MAWHVSNSLSARPHTYARTLRQRFVSQFHSFDANSRPAWQCLRGPFSEAALNHHSTTDRGRSHPARSSETYITSLYYHHRASVSSAILLGSQLEHFPASSCKSIRRLFGRSSVFPPALPGTTPTKIPLIPPTGPSRMNQSRLGEEI